MLPRVFLIICLGGFISLIAPLRTEAVTFIVNESNPIDTISRSALSDLFLKKERYWPNSSLVRFIDREKGRAERDYFLKNVLGMSQRQLDQYWVGKKLYAGDSAPLKAQTDSMALRLVHQLEGGISYISDSTEIQNFNVKPIKVLE